MKEIGVLSGPVDIGDTRFFLHGSRIKGFWFRVRHDMVRSHRQKWDTHGSTKAEISHRLSTQRARSSRGVS